MCYITRVGNLELRICSVELSNGWYQEGWTCIMQGCALFSLIFLHDLS
jgi:hypothetical protein